MKRLALSLAVVIAAYIFVDRELFFYGKSFLKVYSPFHSAITPEYWDAKLGNLGFVLADEHGMNIVSPGTRYFGSEITVQKIHRYGYDENRLFVIVYDSSNSEYLISINEPIKEDSEHGITIVLFQEGKIINDDKLNWINTNNIYHDTFYYVLFRVILILLFVLFSILLILSILGFYSERQGRLF